ncbi:LOW QUALITY PROTEIN: predicted protein, partial [Brucella abortus bv. 3 str. Tulya]
WKIWSRKVSKLPGHARMVLDASAKLCCWPVEFRFSFQGALECRFLPAGESRLSLRHINMAPIYEGSFRLKDTSAASGGM